MSHSLNSLKGGGSIGGPIGYYSGYEGDTRSLDYSSCSWDNLLGMHGHLQRDDFFVHA